MAFAEKLRELHRTITEFDPEHPTQKAISRCLNVSEQHLSNCLHAARLPAKEEVEALRSLAKRAIRRAARENLLVAIPYSLNELLRLRELAIRPCGRCRKWHDAVVSSEVEYGLAERRRADGVNGAGLPGPPAKGDRHPGPDAAPPRWDAVEEIQQLSASGLEAELLTLLSHVGTNTEPDEFPSIVHTLRTSGMDEAADAVVDAAGARPAPVVLEIAFKLHSWGLHDALGRLLSATRTHSRD
jgi:hypothetical protein